MYQETQRMSVLRAARRPPGCGRTGARMRGFTLIELMVTVAIVAVLAAIAYPSYMSHVVRANRASAQGYMLEISNLQQRYLLDARTYATANDNLGLAALNWPVPTNVVPNYAMKTVADMTTTPPSFVTTATPINNQAAKDTTCGTLTINEAGTKTASGTGGVSACW